MSSTLPGIGAYVQAIDYALPARRVDNDALAERHPSWQMERVVTATGVEARYWCDPDETALDLAERACRALAARTGFDLTLVDAVLFCTQSPDYPMPPNACLLQHRLGLRRSLAALDFSLACSGFIYGLYLARALVESGSARHVLLVTADTYSRWMHPDDRGPMTLFGDGAAATLVSAGERKLGAFMLGTDGAGADKFMVPAGGARRPHTDETARPIADTLGNVRSAEQLRMDGPGVLAFVKEQIPPLVHSVLELAELRLSDLDLVLFHQASRVALDHLHRALRISPTQQFSNLRTIGNTVSASLPILLRDAEREGRLRPGCRVLLVGFGVGLSWGGCIVDW
jgi:3-oxoacyl-[acyl-carrier-protein] synthase III